MNVLFRLAAAGTILVCLAACSGLNEPEFRSQRIGFLAHDLDEMELAHEAGAAWARPHPGPFSWHAIQPSRDRWDFSESDAYVEQAGDSEMNLLATIWPFAPWDQKACRAAQQCKVAPGALMVHEIPDMRCMPCDLNRYAAFVRGMVERYDGDGHQDMPGLSRPVKAWEVLNEPEMNDAWGTFFRGSADDYLALARVTHAAVKAACPSCLLVQGGAAAKEGASDKFWDRFYSQGGAKYVDVASVHFLDGHDRQTLNTRAFASLLARHKVKRPIWVTEVLLPPGVSALQAAGGAFGAGADKLFFVGFAPGQTGASDEFVDPEVLDVIRQYP